jgi:hypothetical protein
MTLRYRGRSLTCTPGSSPRVYDVGVTCTELERAWNLALNLRQRHKTLDDHHPAERPWVRFLDAAGGAYLARVGNYLVAATDMWPDMLMDQRPPQSPIGWPHWLTVLRLREQVTVTPNLPGPDPHPAKIAALEALETTDQLLAQRPPVLAAFLELIDQSTRYQLGHLAYALHSYARHCHHTAYQRAIECSGN